MAASDLSNYKESTRKPKVAQETVVDYGTQINDTQNAAAAKTAGVKDAAYIDYDLALDKYAARPDVESLTDRRNRDFPADFADGALMRESVSAWASHAAQSTH